MLMLLKCYMMNFSEVKAENTLLKRRADDMEVYSRKDNLIIRGIDEQKNETEQLCVDAVKMFFKEQLKLDEGAISAMKFVRCHRIGLTNNDNRTSSRNIIVRFMDFKDRKAVFSAGFGLKNNKKYSVFEDYPGKIGYRRRKMYPIYSHAKKIDGLNVSLKADRLIVNNTTYTVDNINALPDNIHPHNLCTVSDDTAFVSGGILSEYGFLSNYVPCKMEYDNETYSNLEQAYQHIRAKHFRDQKLSTKLLATKDPSEAKRLSHQVRCPVGVDYKQQMAGWNTCKKEVMMKLLRIKFAPGSELATRLQATGTKKIAESGLDSFWSCGMRFTDRDILKVNLWKSNVLGELQMAVRQELNN